MWEFLTNPENRARISWLGGGAVAICAGLRRVVTFVIDHRDAADKKSPPAISSTGPAIVSGRDTNITGNVAIGPTPEQIAQIQKPLADQLHDKDAQIAELIKALQARNPGASPAAQEAVGAAVQSIAEGAAQGDARLQQALDLLKANRIADATRVLNAVAEEKSARAAQETARAERDRKDAAIAYRNLGVIAGYGDPKRALEAFAKALALNPDDLESLAWIGDLQADYGDLNGARNRLEHLLAVTRNNGNLSYQYRALLGIGDISLAQGDLATAMKSLSDGLIIINRLATSDPGNTQWQRDLSATFVKIGDVQSAQGNLAGALKSYSDSLDIRSRLAKSDTRTAQWQRDLLVVLVKIGDVQSAQGDLDIAKKSYDNSLDIGKRLSKADPRNAQWQSDLAGTLSLIGNVQLAQGDLAAALKSYSDSLDICLRLVKSDPSNAQWRRDLSISSNKVGDVQLARGDFSAALKVFSDSRDIAERLAGTDPSNARSQRDLAVFDAKLGMTYRQLGRQNEAMEALLAGRARIVALVEKAPDWSEIKRDLLWFDDQIGAIKN